MNENRGEKRKPWEGKKIVRLLKKIKLRIVTGERERGEEGHFSMISLNLTTRFVQVVFGAFW